MKTKIKKIGKIILWIIGIIVGLIVLAMLTGFTLHNTYYKNQLEEVKPYGKMVEVDSENMHVYSMGNGEETIVLLAGFGMPLPSADFAPLMRNLSKKYTVVTVEYFGVGFSGETDKPRTCENYMKEIRTSLHKAGFKPPYILMPHSISGIYSEYYATKYPEEVKGMILLDTTSTAFTMEEMPKEMIVPYDNIGKFLQQIGLLPLLIKRTPGNLLMAENGYTQKEIEDYKKHIDYAINDTKIEQIENLYNCVREVKDLPFPEDIPVLKIIAKQTTEKVVPLTDEDMKKTFEYIGSMEFEEDHLKRLGDSASYVILEGSHIIYRDQTDEIVRLTDEFIANLK
ncbi:alpha/beta hydrolase [Clostridium sp. MSJ-11]|uniref:Alpha/beta hydrolase n=1 Tax=Clostridium mobile TaxID=2841512 RepID=A0ABS6ED64_9CLOT|nr:alpha/beta hydrolase [Clostridium mobile]MBU5483136.1 alpha/beta hydrolase [Clostridium mobile]